VHRTWGLDVRSHSLAWYAQKFYGAMKMTPPVAEIGNPKPTLGEMPKNLHDSDMGFFVIDRDGIVRYKRAEAYVSDKGLNTIPSVDEIVRELERAGKP